MIRFVRSIGEWYMSKHQRFVDWSGKKPLWLARQCAILYAMLSSLDIAFMRKAPLTTLMIATAVTWGLAALLWLVAWLRESLGSAVARRRHPSDDWFALAVIIVDLVLTSFDGNAARIIPSFLFISYFYFSACQNPPPRKPKEKPKHAAAYWCRPNPRRDVPCGP